MLFLNLTQLIYILWYQVEYGVSVKVQNIIFIPISVAFVITFVFQFFEEKKKILNVEAQVNGDCE